MNSSSFEPLHSSKKLPALDGIRGVAILLVLYFHSGYILQVSGAVEFVFSKLASFCWCGVDLFFVLSGFLITGILLDTRDSRHYFRNFYVRRILRIFPLYYGVILWLFLQHSYIPNQIWYWLYLQNWLPVFGDSTPALMLRPFWSLAVEEQFYLVWPFAIYFLNRRYTSWFCACTFLVALVSRCIAQFQNVEPLTIYMVTIFRLDTLSAGALIAIWMRERQQRERLERLMTPCLAISGLALIVVIVIDGGFLIEGRLNQTIGYSLFAIFCALIISAVVMDRPWIKPMNRLLKLKWLQHLGNRSYAIYIFHMLVFIPMIHIYQKYWEKTDVSGFSDMYAFGLGVVITLLLAEISWHCYEKQFLKLKRFFPRNADRVPPLQ